MPVTGLAKTRLVGWVEYDAFMFGRMVSYAAAYTHASPGRDHETAVALDWLSGQQTSDGAQLLVLAPSKQGGLFRGWERYVKFILSGGMAP